MNLFKRMHAVLQIRTGFVAVATSGIGLAYAMSIGLEIKWFIMFLFITAAFAVNIVTNIANGIVGANREDNVYTINDDYKGKNGLVTGVTKNVDAYIALALFTGYTIVCGLLIVILTKSIVFLLIGILSVFIALIYSFGPKPLTDYPVTEVVSGFFCGTLPTVLVIYFNGGHIDYHVLILGVISLLLVAGLMLTNNMCDVEKDKGHRKTLGHVFTANQLVKLYLVVNIINSVLVFLLTTSIFVTIVFAIINLGLLKVHFYNELKTRGTNFKGNKGVYIPRYLKYYYQASILLCLCLFI